MQSRHLLIILAVLIPILAIAQPLVPEYWGIENDGEILVWDGATDNRWEVKDISAALPNGVTTNLGDVTDSVGFATTTGAGGGTFTGVTCQEYYATVGPITNFHVYCTGTCGSTASYLSFTLPTDPFGTVSDYIMSCRSDDVTALPQLSLNYVSNAGTTAYVYKDTVGSGFADGACWFDCTGVYLQ